VLYGPSPPSLIDPVSAADLRKAIVALVPHWNRALDDPTWLRPRNYQAFAILTMCRMLHTLEDGEVSTKPAAAAWARGRLDEPWRSFVDRAMKWRSDHEPDDIDETIGFVRFVLSRIGS